MTVEAILWRVDPKKTDVKALEKWLSDNGFLEIKTEEKTAEKTEKKEN